jgi:serine/threonine protein kinase/DNA-binding SARP family transcriptional activator
MIEFRALGPADLKGHEGTEPGSVLSRPKLLGLLSFLAADRGYHRRDTLIGLFWAELDQERARSAVRQSLYHLRRFLGESAIVTRGDDEVALSPDAFWCDVAAFEEALAADDWKSALALYRGDFLDGLYVPDAPEYERWLDTRRSELRLRASQAAWKAADQEATERHTAAVGDWSRRAIELSPLDERLLRRVIRLLDGLGDRSAAVREFEAFAQRLMDDLELEPSPETKALIDQVRERAHVADEQATPLAPIAPRSEEGLARALAGRYALEREIGAGGMATVYLARDLRNERDVAVKVMRPELATTVGADRFLREISIAAKLNHPHIVPLYDSGLADGYLYFVMPYAQGESLRGRLERDGPLPLGEALSFTREIAGALDHAHSLGIVHRDIKPENILLSGNHALVADFGIARAISAAGGTRLTQLGVPIGTPPYMSPEQRYGSGEIDGRSDIYSLACVLYEMLSGCLPFVQLSDETLAQEHHTTAPRPLTEVRSAVPEAVSAAIVRALSDTPTDRFSTASQFADALFSSTPNRRAWQTLLSRRRAVALAAVPLSLFVIGAILIGRYSRPDLNPNRVVVVPLENRTGDSSLALLGSLAADWITQGLQEIDMIDVVPTATDLRRGPDIAGIVESTGVSDARAAGDETGAGTVVAGAYYLRNDSVEFQAQVIDVTGERLLRAVSPITGARETFNDALDSLRRHVVGAVAATLDRRLMRSTGASRPPSLEAYRLHLEGTRFFYDVPPRIAEALDYFYRAVELDTMFADPRFYLVIAHFNLREWHAADSNAQLLVPSRSRFSPYQRATLDFLAALLRGDRAAALEAARARGIPSDAAVEAFRFNRPHEAIAGLADVGDMAHDPAFYYKWITLIESYHLVGEHQLELAEARRARQTYPDRQRLLICELRALVALGRLDDVDRVLDESLLLPQEGMVSAAIVMMQAARELRAHGYRDASLDAAARAVRWFDTRPPSEQTTARFKTGLADALYLAERWEQARALAEESALANPGDVNAQGFLAVLAARLGGRDEALSISERLEGMAGPYGFGSDVYWQACIASLLGDRERAMVFLREAYVRGRPFSILLHTDMDLEHLRDYRPFQEFIRPKGQ